MLVCHDAVGHVKGNKPWILGGNCCCTPTPENYRQHVADGTIDKSMSHERTFPEDTTDRGLLEGTLLELSDKVARRLRQNGAQCRVVVLKLRDSHFVTVTRQTTLGEPTCCEDDIYAISKRLFYELPARRVRLIGVGVAGLTRDDPACQLPLFDANWERRLRASKAVDRIRDRFGEEAILRATLVGDPGERS